MAGRVALSATVSNMAQHSHRPLLRRFWFRRAVGFGYGVTAYSMEDAELLIEEAELTVDWTEVVENIDVSSLDAGHVLPNVGLVSCRGVWYPALNR